MKVNSVKQFVASNISRFERKGTGPDRIFNLYDKNNVFRGEYKFFPTHRSDFLGVKSSMSITRIMSPERKQEMQEIVCMNKEYVIFKDKNSDTLIKALPSEITTTTTVLDSINDKFKTTRTVSKLKNKLQKLDKNDPDFIQSDRTVIYEPLIEKPQYEKTVECVREGSISEVKKNMLTLKNRFRPNGSIAQIPYIFW